MCELQTFKYMGEVYKGMKIRFTDKYTCPAALSVSQDPNEIKKVQITNETYAIGEIIQALIDKIENKRL